MAMQPIVEFHSRIPQATQRLQLAIFEAVRETFELDIKADAVENSPVTPEGFARNVEHKRPHPGGTGHNRRSIDVEVKITERGVEASIFTQSGYGGYLELGTAQMRAQPYIYPAFERHVSKIPVRIREKIEATPRALPVVSK